MQLLLTTWTVTCRFCGDQSIRALWHFFSKGFCTLKNKFKLCDRVHLKLFKAEMYGCQSHHNFVFASVPWFLYFAWQMTGCLKWFVWWVIGSLEATTKIQNTLYAYTDQLGIIIF